jgi:hypothetical protein
MLHRITAVVLVAVFVHGNLAAQTQPQTSLKTPAQMQRVLRKAQEKGKAVNVTLNKKISNHTKFSGEVSDISDTDFVVIDQKRGTTTKLAYADVKEVVLNDTNLLLRHLKPAGEKIGAPWVSWHTFRRTHATLLQLAGGSAKDAQAQLGHSRITTTLGIYTIPVPAHQRAAVEKLSQLVTNGDEF